MSTNSKIIILTAPSGSGKTTIANFLLKSFDQLRFSISATTRKPRPGEQNGQHYYFMSENEFRQAVADDLLFEHQEVYANQFYGTLNSELDRIWKEGHIALLDIDVKGAFNIESLQQKNCLSIFVKPSNISVLKERLLKRGTDSDEQIKKRLEKAAAEIQYAQYFDYVITNDKLELAQKLIAEITADFINS